MQCTVANEDDQAAVRRARRPLTRSASDDEGVSKTDESDSVRAGEGYGSALTLSLLARLIGVRSVEGGSSLRDRFLGVAAGVGGSTTEGGAIAPVGSSTGVSELSFSANERKSAVLQRQAHPTS